MEYLVRHKKNIKVKLQKYFSNFLARSPMCNRCYKNDWKHFVGDKSSAIHVRRHGSANVQGRR